MTNPLQTHRAARVKTALPDDTLVLAAMDGFEAISKPFALRLTLLGKRRDLEAKALLGTRMSVSLDTGSRVRQFNGVVASFTIAEDSWGDEGHALCRYEAIVRPTLWLLTRGAHCRFFHARTALEIVAAVLGEYGVEWRNACVARYPTLEHCAQYDETDFDFVSRLLEREGIYYFFEHVDGKDRLVLADAPSALAHDGAIDFTQSFVDGRPLHEAIYRWRYTEELASDTVELTAFDFRNAKGSAQQQSLVVRAADGTAAHRLRMAEYAPHYATQEEGRRLAQARIDALQASAVFASGAATARSIRPGGLFALTGHPRAGQNGDYLVVQARYRVRVGDYSPQRHVEPASTLQREQTTRCEPVFDCSFRALPKRRPFRPPRITPRPHAGLQTALVVAASGDEMSTERHGCVKVQFHWEQFDPPAESERMRRCWVRVAQGWAGRNWGMVFMPRAGQEVVIAFIDGDPDRPLVIGSLYNSANPPPYALPAHEAISAIRTASLSGDGERNELRFDDQKPQLLLYAGGRADSYVKRSALAWVGEDAHAIVEGRQLVKVGSHDFTIDGGQRVKVGASASLSAGVDVLHEARVNYAVKGEIVHVKGGASVVLEAGAMLTLKCGGSFVTLTPAGVQISGPLVGLNSGGAAGSAPGASAEMPDAPKKADDGSGAT
ncbi:type VI secretion system Vgr family protein [Trinickia soli]|uniref:Type VI secretion system tip protein VgrG n=1 Tax=Trinickia soli TaxID=380675 RepID=A0A2N7VXR1_9BURK|nr:type VI secretion system tip protein TssI/VgrG [Trinickia soli]PMS21918.1 type VI secretion system tip protein VgrG [Trinickia soli]